MNSNFSRDKWFILIPEEVAERMSLEEGEEVVLLMKGERISVPLRKRTEYDADAMIAAIPEENRHPEVSFGAPVGRERFWEDEEDSPSKS